MKVADIPGPTLLPASFGPATWKYSEFCRSNFTCCDTFKEKKPHKPKKHKCAHLTQQQTQNQVWTEAVIYSLPLDVVLYSVQ